MQVELRERGIDQAVRLLESLPAEAITKRNSPVKLALKKGAQNLRKAAATRLRVSTANTNDAGERFSTGLLEKNLIVSRGKPPLSGNGERYLVRVRAKRYERDGKSTTTTLNGARLEYGTHDQPAEPWLRPAFNEKAEETIGIIQVDLLARIERLARKYLPR